jgi:S-adenosylmethionine decarboxylase proenzyme
MQSVGRHLLVDCWGCGRRADDADGVRTAIQRAVDAMAATLLSLEVHEFSPQGLTAVAILAESHLALHSWPEEDYVAIDAFTCGEAVRAEAGIDLLLDFLEPASVSRRSIARGRSRVAIRPAELT